MRSCLSGMFFGGLDLRLVYEFSGYLYSKSSGHSYLRTSGLFSIGIRISISHCDFGIEILGILTRDVDYTNKLLTSTDNTLLGSLCLLWGVLEF